METPGAGSKPPIRSVRTPSNLGGDREAARGGRMAQRSRTALKPVSSPGQCGFAFLRRQHVEEGEVLPQTAAAGAGLE